MRSDSISKKCIAQQRLDTSYDKEGARTAEASEPLHHFRGIGPWNHASHLSVSAVPVRLFGRKEARYCKTATCNRFVQNSLILHEPQEKTNSSRLLHLSGQRLIIVTSDELSPGKRSSLEYPSRSLHCSLKRVFWSHLTTERSSRSIATAQLATRTSRQDRIDTQERE